MEYNYVAVLIAIVSIVISAVNVVRLNRFEKEAAEMFAKLLKPRTRKRPTK
jgi:hypothetical protein